jgi:uroporphyrin-III C-methyltransferase
MSVFLVGAGPGDPGLITVRGLELVRRCDTLVHDRLVAPELVAEAPPHAVVIGRERIGQEEIDRLIVNHGLAGRTVVRLKGGDPFVFGRGGEEALALAAAGVPFEVVPGVSSIAAVPGAAGIPVTHRGLASQVTIVAGHDPSAIDFPTLARTRGTLVFFMGLERLPEIAAGLIAHGKPAGTPAAAISSGSTAHQREAVAPLGELPHAAAGLEAPALVVVGEVVRVRAMLAEAARRAA